MQAIMTSFSPSTLPEALSTFVGTFPTVRDRDSKGAFKDLGSGLLTSVSSTVDEVTLHFDQEKVVIPTSGIRDLVVNPNNFVVYYKEHQVIGTIK